MIKLMLCLIMLWGANIQPKYWEQMSKIEKEFILNSKGLPNIVKQFMNNDIKLRCNDIDNYWKVIDTLTTVKANNNFLPLYFYLFNNECLNSDGEISEMLGAYCQKMLLIDPNYVIEYLGNNPKLMRKYGNLLGYDLSDYGESPDRPYAYKSFKITLQQKISVDKKSLLKILFDYIDQTIIIIND